MTAGPSLFIAARSLLGRRAGRPDLPAEKRGGTGLRPAGGMSGAILGIGISLIPLILVLVVSDGMIRGITDRYMETKTYHIQVTAPDGFSRSDAERGLEALWSVPGVRAAYFEKDGSGVAVSAAASSAVVMRAVDSSFFSDPGAASYLKLVEGSLVPEGNRDIVLGSALAATLRVKTGSLITVITPNQGAGEGDAAGSSPGFPGYSPKLSFFRVVGIANAGYRDLDALWAFINPRAGESVLGNAPSSSFFGVKVDDPYSNSLGTVRDKLAATISPVYKDWFDPRLARTWPEVEKGLYKSFSTTKSMLLLIMGIALVVAAVNLGSALYTFVVEHSMDIAVLRSVGATDSSIRRIFVGAGLITGCLGTALGLLLGLALSWNVNILIAGLEWLINLADSAIAALRGQPSIPLKLLDPGYYLEKIPISFNAGQIALVAALSVALSAAASLIPARKASRVSVQDLIRKS